MKKSAMATLPYTAGQDEDGLWCAHAWLGSSGGVNGHGVTAEDAVADLREAVRMVFEEDGAGGTMSPWPR